MPEFQALCTAAYAKSQALFERCGLWRGPCVTDHDKRDSGRRVATGANR
jgi:hypothetical protein